MPISNTKDVIPFVNGLEQRIESLNSEIAEWGNYKEQILAALPQIERNKTSSLTAILKADEALSEINTATQGIVAAKGQRLKKLLEDFKKQVIEIAESAVGQGGSSEPYIKLEIETAIASVDSIVEDGLKLDYRLQGIEDIGREGFNFAHKEIIMPFSFKTDMVLNHYEYTLPAQDNIEFVKGEVTVLNSAGTEVLLASNGEAITAVLYESGLIVLSESPNVAVTFVYPGRLQFGDVPEDFLLYTMQTAFSKNSGSSQSLQKIEKVITEIADDIRNMKGVNWTVDHSIMRNHKEIVKETITPKGLNVEVKDGIVNATFSYNDHPELKHFVLERLDPETNEFVPYDGEEGVIAK